MAQRIQHKRSSILGKRPAEQYLEPGELALNTNASDPGLFFETNNGEIAKAGPTSIGAQPPASEVGYGPGESWYDTGNGTMNLWVPALNQWVPVSAPLFGGAPTAIFVGSEFPQATDDLSNDGYARPFISLNRAMLEVARRSILRGRPDDAFNARFSVFLLPGKNVVYNEPGLTPNEFEAQTNVLVEDQALTQKQLSQFNPPTGGLVVPRGTTIFGLDLRKTLITPTYYPVWTRTAYENEPETLAGRSAILKWTGNSYFTSFTFRDKISDCSVTEIAGQSFEVAVLRSLRPHGFRTLVTALDDEDQIIDGDLVTVTYPVGVSRFYNGTPTLPQGQYYAEPIDAYRFKLRKVQTGLAVLRNELPDSPVPGATPNLFLTVSVALGTAHRLTAIQSATDVELDALYDKVQRAFSTLSFAGTASNAEVAPGETIITASTPEVPNIETNSVENSSPYVFNVSLRSQWGISGMWVNGEAVLGFKSALSCNFTVVSVNNDPDVYEVYDDEEWVSLRDAYAESVGLPVSETTREQALNYMVRTVKTDDVRFFYRTAYDIPGQDGKSSGQASDLSDTRHYATTATAGGFVQIVSSFAIGLAINYWARSGGEIAVTNANSNFGGVALRAEGFSGIGTTGGSLEPDRGFTIQGIRRPAVVTQKMVENSTITRAMNARIASTTLTSITLEEPFYAPTIAPYTLRDNTYIYVQDTRNGTEYRARIDGDGGTSNPVTPNGLTIFIVSTTNEIHTALQGGLDPDFLSVPYIKRFEDPRPAIDRQYSLWVQNTSQFHRPPQAQFIVRFAEKPQTGVANLVRPNTQLDPGLKGGWAHVFQIIDSRTKREGDNPNGVEPLITPVVGTESYYVTLGLVDGFRPWVSTADNGYGDGVNIPYAGGQYSTYNGRLFYPQTNDLASGAFKLEPNNDLSVWTRSKNFEFCSPVDEAWVAADGLATIAEDPYVSAYPENATYPRGLQYELPDMVVNNVIDEDDGTPTLGIVSNGVVDPAKYDPWWSPSKLSMARFMRLLGFEYAQIDTMLRPQLWSQRNLPTSSMPAVSGAGYALATGTWPVEFNRPSVIRCGNHTWEWCGYINYTKGLPQYQTTQLSLRERFDFMQTALWGGQVYSTGTNEKGEYVFSGKTVAAGTGDILLNTNIPLVPAPLPAPIG